MTGLTVKFGSKQRSTKATPIHQYYPDMFVHINGGVSRISSRPYAPCYYYVANEIQRSSSNGGQARTQRGNNKTDNRVNEEYTIHSLPDYRAVVRDVDGKQFKFVNPPPSYRESC